MSILRLGLAGAAIVFYDLATHLWFAAAPFRGPLDAAPCFAAWALGTTAAILALARSPRATFAWLGLVAAVAALWGHAWAAWDVTAPLTGDRPSQAMTAELSARVLRGGANPYAWDYSDAPAAFQDRGRLVPRALDGSVSGRLAAPAFTTLALAALDTVGLGEARFLSLAAHTLLLVLVFVGAPGIWRPVVLFPILAARSLTPSTLAGGLDTVWSAFLVAAVLAWERPLLAAVLLGAAGTVSLQPWLVLPFAAVAFWDGRAPRVTRAESAGRVARFLAVAGATFLALDLPFIAWDPTAWWLGVTTPVRAPFVIVSDGLATLTQYGLVSLPRLFYSVLTAASLLALVVFHWRQRSRIGGAFWIFPALLLWLPYRSFGGDWLFWLPPLVVALCRDREARTLGVPGAERSWRLDAVSALALLALVGSVGAGMALDRPSIRLAAIGPFEVTTDGRVAALTLEVTNPSDRALAPRFAAQETGAWPSPWAIVSGPATVGPGSSARYRVRARRLFETVGRDGGQLILTDAGGDYALRALLTVPLDPTLADPDLLANADFSRWAGEGAAPWGWDPRSTARSEVRARLDSIAGRPALVLSARGAGPAIDARLVQRVTMASVFAIWVRPREMSRPDGTYGLELDDGRHSLTLNFGGPGASQASSGASDDGRVRATLAIPASPGAWSRHRIDVAALWAQQGWELPPPTRRTVNGLEYAASQAWLSLVVSGRGREAAAIFGPIEPESRPLTTVVARTLEKPEGYWLALGYDRYRERNWRDARRAFERAATANSDSADAYAGIGWSILAESEAGCLEAETYFEAALALQPTLSSARLGLGRCR